MLRKLMQKGKIKIIKADMDALRWIEMIKALVRQLVCQGVQFPRPPIQFLMTSTSVERVRQLHLNMNQRKARGGILQGHRLMGQVIGTSCHGKITSFNPQPAEDVQAHQG